jgi:hypothetical protein
MPSLKAGLEPSVESRRPARGNLCVTLASQSSALSWARTVLTPSGFNRSQLHSDEGPPTGEDAEPWAEVASEIETGSGAWRAEPCSSSSTLGGRKSCFVSFFSERQS